MNVLTYLLIVINYFSEKLKLWVLTNVLDVSPIRELLDRGNKKEYMYHSPISGLDLLCHILFYSIKIRT